MGRLLGWFIEAQMGWGRRLGSVVQPPITSLFGKAASLRSFLNGTWLGHPLHPALTDLPVGALVVAFVLDIANQRTAADVTIVIGLLGLAGAAISGLADYADTYGRTRDTTTVHATVMVIALVLYLISLAMRAQSPGDRTVPIAIAFVGLLLVAFGAFIGGDLVFRLGNVVNRHAWDEEAETGPGEWTHVDVGQLPEGQPVKGLAGSESIVMIRWGDTVFAMASVCSHAGGPLEEGTLHGDTIQCPWHGSRFRVRDGSVVGGPAVFDQPRYEVRAAGSGYEARRL